MKEAQFQYKCRMCGEIDNSLCCGEDYAQQRFIEAILTGKSMHNDHSVNMIWTHTCKDGSTGVTDLIGYKVI